MDTFFWKAQNALADFISTNYTKCNQNMEFVEVYLGAASGVCATNRSGYQQFIRNCARGV